MVNEDIVTALKNAVEHGESLEQAMNTAINSGYNPREVEEASRFVGASVSTSLQIKPEEHLTMPEEKGIFSKIFRKKPIRRQSIGPLIPEPVSEPQQRLSQASAITKPLNRPLTRPLSKELTKIRPPKESWAKEIVLLIILLILIGTLILIILYRDKILGWFSW